MPKVTDEALDLLDRIIWRLIDAREANDAVLAGAIVAGIRVRLTPDSEPIEVLTVVESSLSETEAIQ